MPQSDSPGARKLSRETLDSLKVALSSALRTTDQSDPTLGDRFVELRPGTVATLEASVNHLITGRRGVGKSTTLAVLQQRAQAQGAQVIFVDVETHKSRAYPDVLIEIVLDILDAIRPKWTPIGKRWELRRQISRLTDVLIELRDAAPEVTHSTEEQNSRAKDSSVRLSGAAAKKF